MLRFGPDPADVVLSVSNFTPVPRYGYRLGVPAGGTWREILNTDACEYAGSGLGNGGQVAADDESFGGYSASLSLTVPPLATIYLEHDRNA